MSGSSGIYTLCVAVQLPSRFIQPCSSMTIRTVGTALFLLGATLGAQSDSTRHDSTKADLPLPAARTVAIDVDEGTWISLDVSPDGQTIVFDLLGDLYTIPVAGGQATLLLGGIPFDMQPRFSPDGKR